jgi:hypothetical protein
VSRAEGEGLEDEGVEGAVEVLHYPAGGSGRGIPSALGYDRLWKPSCQGTQIVSVRRLHQPPRMALGKRVAQAKRRYARPPSDRLEMPYSGAEARSPLGAPGLGAWPLSSGRPVGPVRILYPVV